MLESADPMESLPVPWPAGGDAFFVVDLETTGLDPRRDDILQVAYLAVAPTGITRWSSLVRPDRPVPPDILRLTGLDLEALRAAPPAEDVRRHAAAVLTDAPVVGHNIDFDRGFLDRWGVRTRRALDTLTWARIAFPRRTTHRLEELAPVWQQHVGASEDRPFHNAVNDVEATWALCQAIRARLAQLAADDQALLARLMPVDWPFWRLGPSDVGPPTALSPLWRRAPDRSVADPPASLPFADGRPAFWFGAEGTLARGHSGWESRPGQLTLAEAVDEALADGATLAAEAATGIGKSLAYLMPALVAAAHRGERVVVATNTLALQDQLWQKDVPEALSAFGTPVPAALMKGRSRYACLLKVDDALNGPQLSWDLTGREDDGAGWASLVVWLSETPDGERDDWAVGRLPGAASVGDRAWADADACAGSRCPYAGPCYLRESRRQAQESLLVVTNHAQLLTHAMRGDVLPPFRHLIVDEAHRLEATADQILGVTLPLRRQSRQLRDESGDGSPFHRIRDTELLPLAGIARDRWRLLAQALLHLADGSVALLANGDTAKTVRAHGEAWATFQARGFALLTTARTEARRAQAAKDDLIAAARAMLSDDEWNQPGWLQIRRMANRLDDLVRDLEAFLADAPADPNEDPSSTDWVDWWEMRTDDRPEVVLRRAAVHPGQLLRDSLWRQVLGGRVLVSATLTVEAEWSYFLERVGLSLSEDGVRRLILPSPFAVAERALLAIPEDVPDPRDPQHLAHAADAIHALAVGTGGRMLVLTTSRQATVRLDDLLRTRLAAHGLTLLTQGRDGPPGRLAQVLRHSPGCVVLGTTSLWEGIDVPGRALTTVVVTRLPFGYLGDPLDEARREALTRQGRSAFRHLSLPEAVLRFRQGFGRLLRTGEDFGAVVVLDPRVTPRPRGYGRTFIDSVAGPRLIQGPTDMVVAAVIQFIAAKLEGDGRQHAHPVDQ